MNQAQFKMIIWREAPKKVFSYNPRLSFKRGCTKSLLPPLAAKYNSARSAVKNLFTRPQMIIWREAPKKYFSHNPVWAYAVCASAHTAYAHTARYPLPFPGSVFLFSSF
jgi:hypothetical protein